MTSLFEFPGDTEIGEGNVHGVGGTSSLLPLHLALDPACPSAKGDLVQSAGVFSHQCPFCCLLSEVVANLDFQGPPILALASLCQHSRQGEELVSATPPATVPRPRAPQRCGP